MIKNKHTFFLGVFIILIWIFLGVPRFWKTALTVLSGVYLIVVSVKINLPRRGPKKFRRKETVTPVFTENSPMPTVPMPTLPDVENKQ